MSIFTMFLHCEQVILKKPCDNHFKFGINACLEINWLDLGGLRSKVRVTWPQKTHFEHDISSLTLGHFFKFLSAVI